MKPYFEKNKIRLYHGDCRDVIPQLGHVNLVLTDPPYGVRLGSNKPNSDIKRTREACISTDDSPEFVASVEEAIP